MSVVFASQLGWKAPPITLWVLFIGLFWSTHTAVVFNKHILSECVWHLVMLPHRSLYACLLQPRALHTHLSLPNRVYWAFPTYHYYSGPVLALLWLLHCSLQGLWFLLRRWSCTLKSQHFFSKVQNLLCLGVTLHLTVPSCCYWH